MNKKETKNINWDKFSLNGKIFPIKKADISILNIEYQYGFGVYETMRVNNNTPFFLAQHIDRLLRSARIIRLGHAFSEKQLTEYVKELIKKLKKNTYNLKLLLIGGNTKEDSLIYLIPSNPLFPEKKLFKNGASLITADLERVFPEAKTLNMLPSYLVYKKAQKNNCYDALCLDGNGFIREGTRANFFAIKKNVIYKAPKGTILDGVTQRIVLSIAAKNGYEIEERNIKKENLKDFDGFFLTSTSAKIMPISKIDELSFPVPESLNKLRTLVDIFFDNCQGVFKD
jgi:branched-chain amino acid aminotransferase